MRGAERFGDPGRERDGLAQGEWPPPEASLEVFAVDPLHGKESLSRGRHAVRDVADDARVGELREDLDLAREALGEVALLVGDDLDGHCLIGDRIMGAEHHSHAAAADRLLDLEPVSEQLPRDHERISMVQDGTMHAVKHRRELHPAGLLRLCGDVRRMSSSVSVSFTEYPRQP